MSAPDWRNNPRITVLTSAQVENLDREKLAIGRERDEAKRAKLLEKYELRQAIYAKEAREQFCEYSNEDCDDSRLN